MSGQRYSPEFKDEAVKQVIRRNDTIRRNSMDHMVDLLIINLGRQIHGEQLLQLLAGGT